MNHKHRLGILILSLSSINNSLSDQCEPQITLRQLFK